MYLKGLFEKFFVNSFWWKYKKLLYCLMFFKIIGLKLIYISFISLVKIVFLYDDNNISKDFNGVIICLLLLELKECLIEVKSKYYLF